MVLSLRYTYAPSFSNCIRLPSRKLRHYTCRPARVSPIPTKKSSSQRLVVLFCMCAPAPDGLVKCDVKGDVPSACRQKGPIDRLGAVSATRPLRRRLLLSCVVHQIGALELGKVDFIGVFGKKETRGVPARPSRIGMNVTAAEMRFPLNITQF